ncbi:hypothetical protein DA2_2590 [Desulfovibrio sp. A2]|nr:hypothetical protein DA2_2590 [Desulfovibrio sp. A2]
MLLGRAACGQQHHRRKHKHVPGGTTRVQSGGQESGSLHGCSGCVGSGGKGAAKGERVSIRLPSDPKGREVPGAFLIGAGPGVTPGPLARKHVQGYLRCERHSDPTSCRPSNATRLPAPVRAKANHAEEAPHLGHRRAR